MSQYCFLNGEVLPLAEAKISILDIGLIRGYGIYEALTVINGKPLHFKDHWQRLLRGAKALGIKIPIENKLAEEKIVEIVKKSGLNTRASIRIVLTGGEVLNGIEHDVNKPTFYMIAEEWKALPKENYEKGAKLITHEYKREMPEFKTTNYIMGASLQDLRKGGGALEILYVSDDLVLECATSNIFLVNGDKVITPEEGVLKGITRKIVLELARKDYQVEKREVTVDEFKSADEVFITASFKDIVPIIKIDDFTVGSGAVGKITRDIMGKFQEYIRLQSI